MSAFFYFQCLEILNWKSGNYILFLAWGALICTLVSPSPHQQYRAHQGIIIHGITEGQSGGANWGIWSFKAFLSSGLAGQPSTSKPSQSMNYLKDHNNNNLSLSLSYAIFWNAVCAYRSKTSEIILVVLILAYL